jgi:hypothetical protein
MILSMALQPKKYEISELGSKFNDYNSEAMPFLKVIKARITQVRAQLDRIKSKTLPREGIYGKNEVCPDWRDSNGDNYVKGETIVNSDSCNYGVCVEAAPCYSNSLETCGLDGKLLIPECEPASPFCNNCFPYSRCGSYKDKNSGELVVSDLCGSKNNLASACKDASGCFNHQFGICAFNGDVLIEECRDVEAYCKSCFPNSRCGMNPSETPSQIPSETPSKIPSETPSKIPSAAPSKSERKKQITSSVSKGFQPCILVAFSTILCWYFIA